MKKFFCIAAALVLLFAALPVSANTIPGSKIALDAIKVDYVSALAGIAKPTTQSYTENEKFAVLVSVDVPSWYDVSNMKTSVKTIGLTLDNALPGKPKTGDYLLFGTLYSSGASIEITIQDNAIGTATTAQALWAAVYGDRTVSTNITFAPATTYTAQTAVQVIPVADVPATGATGKITPVLFSISLLALGVGTIKKNYGGA